MKTSGAKKVHYDSGPNMTPLVDVVMVILIFLMLCGSFGGAEHYLESNLPVLKHGGPADANVKKSAFDDIRLDIRIDRDAVNPNAWKARFGDKITGDPLVLKKLLREKLNTFEAAGSRPDTLEVVITSNQTVKWKSLLSVYSATMDAGFTKIALAN